MRRTPGTAALAAVLLVASACSPPAGRSPAPSDAAPEIRLNLEAAPSGTVDVVGLSAKDLRQLERGARTDEWTSLLRVAVAGDPAASADRPAVLGAYSVTGSVLRFTPRFPFDPGQRYEVLLDPAHLPSASGSRDAEPRVRRLQTTVQVPAPERHATTRVVEVYPTALEVPENQLRLYISFSAPMGLRGGAGHVRLEDERGREVVDPFLPLEVDLWNGDRTRYTLLFDPGRVKRGILPNEEMGRSLIAGRRYTLVVETDWRDAAGQPLAAAFRREFRVGPPQEHAVDPAAWRLEVPPDGTRNPLIASFPKPLDYGLLQRALSVSDAAGRRVDGDIQLQGAETRWLFTPHAPWQAGEYRLVAASILEDVAGNRIGRPFEVDALLERPDTQQPTAAALPFRIPSRAQ
jgi:hypothetical protein